jgi:hypothetical protein
LPAVARARAALRGSPDSYRHKVIDRSSRILWHWYHLSQAQSAEVAAALMLALFNRRAEWTMRRSVGNTSGLVCRVDLPADVSNEFHWNCQQLDRRALRVAIEVATHVLDVVGFASSVVLMYLDDFPMAVKLAEDMSADPQQQQLLHRQVGNDIDDIGRGCGISYASLGAKLLAHGRIERVRIWDSAAAGAGRL